jgi:heavy metal sensor kinase
MRTLRLQISLGVTLVVFVAVLSFAGRYFLVTLEWTRRDALDMAKDKTVRIGRWISPDPEKIHRSFWAEFEGEAHGFQAAILGGDGQFDVTNASRYFPEGPFEVPEAYRTNAFPWRAPYAQEVRALDGERYAAAWYPLGHPGDDSRPPSGWTVATIRLADFDRRAEALKSSMWIRLLGISIGTWILTFLMLGLWTRALTSTADAAEQLAQGDLALQRLAPPKADSELRRLVVAFNSLLDRVRHLHSAQQRFVADAAHELRTPLTILRGEIQVALRKEREPERYQAVLQSNLEEVIRLSRLVENLLALARADAGLLLSHREVIDAGALCRQCCEKLRPAAERALVGLRVVAPRDARVHADPVALDRVVFNLVDNAIRYSASDDEVHVRVAAADSEVRIEVQDHGPGITPEHLPRVFDRFHRVDSARNRNSGGAGLGLAIVKSLTEAHGGRVEVRSEVGKGSTFIVFLPRHP